ncbi:hypothetical protein IGI53_000253 [Enterococcus sp. DIV0788_1]
MTESNSCLNVGDLIEVKTIDGSIEKGTILYFEERTVVISVGVKCYLVRKNELEKQNYVLPPFRPKQNSHSFVIR